MAGTQRFGGPLRDPQRATTAQLSKRAVWLILLTFFIPGSVQLVAGNRRLARIGLVATLSFWALGVLALLLGLINKAWLFGLVTAPVLAFILAAFLIGYAVLFAVLALDTLRLLQLRRLPRRPRLIGLAGLVLVGILGTSGIGYAGNLAGVQSNLMGSIFNQGGFTQAVDGRYNILLLGGDAGRDRFGLRPDSISVLSIDAVTGETVNIGIPRNLQKAPFVAGSPMLSVYPNGWSCGVECLINAIYKDVTDNHADLYPNAESHGSTPGVEATKDAVEAVTGLTIQSYVLVDMAGFKRLIDALGGITITVKDRLPIGGQEDANGQPINVKGWIEPGTQHMDGATALWFARARHGSSDYARMQRQREVEEAMLQQLDPANVLARFQDIAGAGKQLVKTDIPNGMVGTYLDLAIKAKKAGIKPLQLVPPTIDVVNPDFTAIHQLVQQTIKGEATTQK